MIRLDPYEIIHYVMVFILYLFLSGWTEDSLPELKDVSVLLDKKSSEYAFIVNYLQNKFYKLNDRVNKGIKIDWQIFFVENNSMGSFHVPVSWNLIEIGIVDLCVFQRHYNTKLPRKMADVISCIVGAFLRQWEYENMALFIAGHNSPMPFSIIEHCSVEHRRDYVNRIPFFSRMESLEDCLVLAVLSFEMERIQNEFLKTSS